MISLNNFDNFDKLPNNSFNPNDPDDLASDFGAILNSLFIELPANFPSSVSAENVNSSESIENVQFDDGSIESININQFNESLIKGVGNDQFLEINAENDLSVEAIELTLTEQINEIQKPTDALDTLSNEYIETEITSENSFDANIKSNELPENGVENNQEADQLETTQTTNKFNNLLITEESNKFVNTEAISNDQLLNNEGDTSAKEILPNSDFIITKPVNNSDVTQISGNEFENKNTNFRLNKVINSYDFDVIKFSDFNSTQASTESKILIDPTSQFSSSQNLEIIKPLTSRPFPSLFKEVSDAFGNPDLSNNSEPIISFENINSEQTEQIAGSKFELIDSVENVSAEKTNQVNTTTSFELNDQLDKLLEPQNISLLRSSTNSKNIKGRTDSVDLYEIDNLTTETSTAQKNNSPTIDLFKKDNLDHGNTNLKQSDNSINDKLENISLTPDLNADKNKDPEITTDKNLADKNIEANSGLDAGSASFIQDSNNTIEESQSLSQVSTSPLKIKHGDLETPENIKSDHISRTNFVNHQTRFDSINTEIEPKKIVEQVDNSIREFLSFETAQELEEKPQILKLRLRPAELGEVEIQLERNSLGKLSVHFEAEHKSTQKILVERFEQLQDSLQDSGWQVEDLDFSNSSNNSSSSNGFEYREEYSRETFIENKANKTSDFDESQQLDDSKDKHQTSRLVNLRA